MSPSATVKVNDELAGRVPPSLPLMPAAPPGTDTTSVVEGMSGAARSSRMVVGLLWTQVPATAGARVGVTDPRETGDENVMLTSPLDAAVFTPEAGEVAAMARCATGFGMVVPVALPPPPPPLPPADVDRPRP